VKSPHCTFVAFVFILFSPVAYSQVVPNPKPPLPPNSGLTPVYPPSAGASWTKGNPSCGNTCTNGPVRFTPAIVEGCEGVNVNLNFRTVTHDRNPTLLSDRGDTIENQGGSIDWGDGQTTTLDPKDCCSWNASHVYLQARQYAASARFGQQFTNARNPAGGCSYRCTVSQSAVVTIYPKTAPICTGRKTKH